MMLHYQTRYLGWNFVLPGIWCCRQSGAAVRKGGAFWHLSQENRVHDKVQMAIPATIGSS
jgi:hypothetical protein